MSNETKEQGGIVVPPDVVEALEDWKQQGYPPIPFRIPITLPEGAKPGTRYLQQSTRMGIVLKELPDEP